METPEALQQRVRREQQMIARLRLAMTRLADAEQERIWGIVAAKEAGLSIRQIARATGVSPTPIHQLLQADEARAIPCGSVSSKTAASRLRCSQRRAALTSWLDPRGRRSGGPPLVPGMVGAVRT